MKRVVVIGGGHGQATIMKALKNLKDVDLCAIVTVADDGGSTGRLRELYNIPAVGDIRNVLVSLSDSKEFNELFAYRFKGEDESDVSGHSLGNLVLAALIEINNGSLPVAIKEMGRMMKTKGRVIPSSLDTISLYAKYKNGSIEKGEANIPSKLMHIDKVFYDHDVPGNKEAINAILKADLIVYGIGSLYTSIMPNVIIKDINDALNESKAKKIYFANAMTQRGETYNYNLKEHVDAFRRHNVPLDLVVAHKDKIPEDILARYIVEEAIEVKDEGNNGVEVISRSLLDFSKNNVRHSPVKIRKVVKSLLEKL